MVAHRPVPVAAAIAIAVAGDLPVSRTFDTAGRARARHLHPDRRGHRRLPVDAGGAAGARAVSYAAREGVRRSGARIGHDRLTTGNTAHPAELIGARGLA